MCLQKSYHALIRSKIDYCCGMYGSGRRPALRILDIVHHSDLRLCSGAFWTSPSPFFMDCCESSLDLRRHLLSEIF